MANLTGPLSYCDKCHQEVGGLFIKTYNDEFWCRSCVEEWLKEMKKENQTRNEIIKSIMEKYETL